MMSFLHYVRNDDFEPLSLINSSEYHFFGALGGFLCAIVFRRWDPKPTQKAYSWEQQVGEDYMIEEEDLIIGDQWKTEKQKEFENSKTTKDFGNPDFPWK